VEDESPWVGPGPQGFCRVFGLVGFFVGGFFFNVGFFGPSPYGSGPNPVGWAKLTPLHIMGELPIK